MILRSVILKIEVGADMLKHEIIIVGGGLAGLRAAVELNGKCDVAIFCKRYPNEAHSSQAQGGINAAINPKDKWEDHAYDTIYGADFLADQDAVEVLCKDAPRVINEMVEFGVNFTRTESGEIAQRPFGGQRFIRTCFAADRTGHSLLYSLYKKALELGVRVYNEWQIVALATSQKQITGVVAIDRSNGQFVPIQSKAVIFATGGAGRVYGKTTNPENTGEGIGIAYQIGAGIMDMEMVQFHPTTLTGPNVLLSEASRGEGAHLINSKGERFMKNYAPEKMELAPRDIVSRSIAREIQAGRGIDGDSVYLDYRHLDKEIIMSKLPDMRQKGIELVGVDILHNPIKIQPGQHYTMAGVATDVNCKTEVDGLFAAGECACVSVHGANRLGGNSLMETLVFGRRAGISALDYIKNKNFESIDQKLVQKEEKRAKDWINNSKKTELMPRNIRIKMGKVMDDFVGPFRDAKMLETAIKKIHELKKEFSKVAVTEYSNVFNFELQSAYETMFMLELAECTAMSAIHRTESRGAHFRTDYPKRDDKNWLKHIVCHSSENGPKLSYRKVKLGIFEPVERHY